MLPYSTHEAATNPAVSRTTGSGCTGRCDRFSPVPEREGCGSRREQVGRRFDVMPAHVAHAEDVPEQQREEIPGARGQRDPSTSETGLVTGGAWHHGRQ